MHVTRTVCACTLDRLRVRLHLLDFLLFSASQSHSNVLHRSTRSGKALVLLSGCPFPRYGLLKSIAVEVDPELIPSGLQLWRHVEGGVYKLQWSALRTTLLNNHKKNRLEYGGKQGVIIRKGDVVGLLVIGEGRKRSRGDFLAGQGVGGGGDGTMYYIEERHIHEREISACGDGKMGVMKMEIQPYISYGKCIFSS